MVGVAAALTTVWFYQSPVTTAPTDPATNARLGHRIFIPWEEFLSCPGCDGWIHLIVGGPNYIADLGPTERQIDVPAAIRSMIGFNLRQDYCNQQSFDLFLSWLSKATTQTEPGTHRAIRPPDGSLDCLGIGEGRLRGPGDAWVITAPSGMIGLIFCPTGRVISTCWLTLTDDSNAFTVEAAPVPRQSLWEAYVRIDPLLSNLAATYQPTGTDPIAFPAFTRFATAPLRN